VGRVVTAWFCWVCVWCSGGEGVPPVRMPPPPPPPPLQNGLARLSASASESAAIPRCSTVSVLLCIFIYVGVHTEVVVSGPF
jgi:hypothetical protein